MVRSHLVFAHQTRVAAQLCLLLALAFGLLVRVASRPQHLLLIFALGRIAFLALCPEIWMRLGFRLVQSIDRVVQALLDTDLTHVLVLVERDLTDLHRCRLLQVVPHRVHHLDVVDLVAGDAVRLDQLGCIFDYRVRDVVDGLAGLQSKVDVGGRVLVHVEPDVLGPAPFDQVFVCVGVVKADLS